MEFQGKDPRETFQFYFRQHWMRMTLPFARALVFTALIVGVGAFTFLGENTTNAPGRRLLLLFFLLFLGIVQFDFLSRFYRYFLYVVIVTDRKVHNIKKTLLAYDEHESVDLWVLQDIHKSQRGLFQNLLNFGTLTLEAQDTHIRLHFTPCIQQRYKELMHLRERARA